MDFNNLFTHNIYIFIKLCENVCVNIKISYMFTVLLTSKVLNTGTNIWSLKI